MYLGELVANYVSLPPGASSPSEYAAKLHAQGADYGGFNLLVGQFQDGKEELAYITNRENKSARTLTPGLYGLSNQTLDDPWPKVVVSRGTSLLAARWQIATPHLVILCREGRRDFAIFLKQVLGKSRKHWPGTYLPS